jgi:hypothetical protein
MKPKNVWSCTICTMGVLHVRLHLKTSRVLKALSLQDQFWHLENIVWVRRSCLAEAVLVVSQMDFLCFS